MALINCPKCGHEISDVSIQCPKCKCYHHEYLKKMLLKRKIAKAKKKIVIVGLLVLSVIVGICIRSIYFEKKNSIVKEEKNTKSKTISETKKIAKASRLIGKQGNEEGKVEYTQEMADFIKNVSLFGCNGSFAPCILGKTEDYKINAMMWQQDDKAGKENIAKIVKGLHKLYGEYDSDESSYMEIKKGYIWYYVEQYSWVICGINNDNNRIIIYWCKE